MNQLILLHGALGSSAQISALRQRFEEAQYNVQCPNLPGHGGRLLHEKTFSMDTFVLEIIESMDGKGIAHADFFGYSMGGYLALLIANRFPHRVGRIATLGTKLDWTPESALQERKYLNVEKILERVPHFAEALRVTHSPLDWKELVQNTDQLIAQLGASPLLRENQLHAIEQKVLFMIAENDKSSGSEANEKLAVHLKNVKLDRVDGAHAIESIDCAEVFEKVHSFFLSQKT